MSDWVELQSIVSKALVNPDIATPKGISPLKDGSTPVKRFNVYRNNVAYARISVLRDTFPVVESLVGEDFFRPMANAFASKIAPASPVLIEYGDKFPRFIESYQPAKELGYLPDIAQVEWSRNVAYYSADEQPILIDCLANYEETEIPNLTFKFHNSLHLMQSDHPVFSIWSAHQNDNPQEHLKQLSTDGEAVMSLRPHLDVITQFIAPATYPFISSLHQGKTFAQAVEAAVKVDNVFDIPGNLVDLFRTGAVTAVCE